MDPYVLVVPVRGDSVAPSQNCATTASGSERMSDSHTSLGTGLVTVGRPSAALTLPPRGTAHQRACPVIDLRQAANRW